MNPSELQKGDVVLARHSQARGPRQPVITESHVAVQKVYPKDRLVVGTVIKRFVYVEGSPDLGQSAPKHELEEAFDFAELVSMVSPNRASQLQKDPGSPLDGRVRLQLVLDVTYELGSHTPEEVRQNLESLARLATNRGLLTESTPEATVDEFTHAIEELPVHEQDVERPACPRA